MLTMSLSLLPCKPLRNYCTGEGPTVYRHTTRDKIVDRKRVKIFTKLIVTAQTKVEELFYSQVDYFFDPSYFENLDHVSLDIVCAKDEIVHFYTDFASLNEYILNKNFRQYCKSHMVHLWISDIADTKVPFDLMKGWLVHIGLNFNRTWWQTKKNRIESFVCDENSGTIISIIDDKEEIILDSSSSNRWEVLTDFQMPRVSEKKRKVPFLHLFLSRFEKLIRTDLPNIVLMYMNREKAVVMNENLYGHVGALHSVLQSLQETGIVAEILLGSDLVNIWDSNQHVYRDSSSLYRVFVLLWRSCYLLWRECAMTERSRSAVKSDETCPKHFVITFTDSNGFYLSEHDYNKNAQNIHFYASDLEKHDQKIILENYEFFLASSHHFESRNDTEKRLISTAWERIGKCQVGDFQCPYSLDTFGEDKMICGINYRFYPGTMRIEEIRPEFVAAHYFIYFQALTNTEPQQGDFSILSCWTPIFLDMPMWQKGIVKYCWSTQPKQFSQLSLKNSMTFQHCSLISFLMTQPLLHKDLKFFLVIFGLVNTMQVTGFTSNLRALLECYDFEYPEATVHFLYLWLTGSDTILQSRELLDNFIRDHQTAEIFEFTASSNLKAESSGLLSSITGCREKAVIDALAREHVAKLFPINERIASTYGMIRFYGIFRSETNNWETFLKFISKSSSEFSNSAFATETLPLDKVKYPLFSCSKEFSVTQLANIITRSLLKAYDQACEHLKKQKYIKNLTG